MQWSNLKNDVIMGYQFRPYLSVRSNGKVFLSTVIGCVTLPYDMVFNESFGTESRALDITMKVDTQWKQHLETDGYNYENLFDEEDTEAEKMDKIDTLAQETNNTVEFIKADIYMYTKIFDVDDSVLKTQLVDGTITGHDTTHIDKSMNQERWPETFGGREAVMLITTLDADKTKVLEYMNYHELF